MRRFAALMREVAACAIARAGAGATRSNPSTDSGQHRQREIDAPDDAKRVATRARLLDFDVEDSVEPLHPAHEGRRKRRGLANGEMSPVGDDAVAVLEVPGEHAVESRDMGARAWQEGARGRRS